MGFKGKRSNRVGPWHHCARCGFKFHIAEMEWQRGLLLCRQYCYDTSTTGFPLIGQVEQAIAQVFTTPTQELMPDPKLTDTTQIEGSMDEIIY